MTLQTYQPSFAGGEYSPSIYPRTDLEKFRTGLSTCRNFVVHPQGGASNRCGMKFIEEAKYSDSLCVAVEFIFNQDQSYILEVGNRYIRFYTDGERIENAGTAYEVTTEYLQDDLQGLRFESSADVIYITHPDYQTQTLTRYGNADWRLEDYSPDDGPFMPENLDEGISLTLSATTGTTTLAVSSALTMDANTQLLMHFDGVDQSVSFVEETGKMVTAYGNAQIDTAVSKFGGSSGLFNGAGIDSFTKLILHFNGLDGSTTFLDSETTPKTVTALGTAQIDTDQSKFGGASGIFDGSGYLTLEDSADWSFGTDSFTIDTWVRFSSLSGIQYIYSQRDDGSNYVILYMESGTSFKFLAGNAGTIADYSIAVSLSTNTWYHIALVRHGTGIYFFLNGVVQSLTTNTAIGSSTMPNLTNIIGIGARTLGAGPTGTYLTGWLDEFRVSKGVARWLSGFYVPVGEYSTGDYLTIPDSADFNFSTGAFTIDFWANFNETGGTHTIAAQYEDANNYWLIQLSSGKLRMIFVDGGVAKGSYIMTSAWSLAVNTSYHLEFVRHGTTGTIFIDGSSQTITTTTSFSTNDVGDMVGSLYVGQFGDSSGYMLGHIEELRISKGLARHTANFTPATSAHSLFNSVSGFNFSPRHVGALFKLRHYVEGQTATAAFASATSSSSIRCFTTWRIITHGTWTGKIRIEKSTNNGTTWTSLRSFSSTDDFNANTSGTEDVETNLEPFLIRVTMYSYTSGTCNVDLTSDPFYQDGIVRVVSFTSVTSVQVTVLQTAGAITATTTWSEGSWSDYRGYPSVARFYQDRLCFANTNSEPQTIWMSRTGDYTSFRRSSTLLDTDGITINLPSRQLNAINGLLAFRKLLAFTSSSVWSVGPTVGNALTPTTVQTDVEEYSGSAEVNQLVIGSEAFYVQSDGEVVKNIGYQIDKDGFTGSETNVLAKHLFEGYTILKMAYQRKPNSILWCLRDDGVLLSLTYLAEQQVVAWARHDTDGVVESIAVIPSSTSDELWLVVNRFNGRFIEKMDGRKQHRVDEHVFLDSYITVESNTLVISGLTHLAGQEVNIIADGVVLSAQTVPSTGTLTMTAIYGDVHAGLQYDADVETLNIDVLTSEGTIQGNMVKIGNVNIKFLNTRGGYIGPNESLIYEAFDYAKLNSENLIENNTTLGVTSLYSGNVRIPLGSEYKRGGRIFYRQSKPLPVTIGAISPEFEIGGRKS